MSKALEGQSADEGVNGAETIESLCSWLRVLTKDPQNTEDVLEDVIFINSRGVDQRFFFGWRLGGRLIKGSWGTSFNNLDDVFDGFEIDPRHPDAIQSYGT